MISLDILKYLNKDIVFSDYFKYKDELFPLEIKFYQKLNNKIIKNDFLNDKFIKLSKKNISKMNYEKIFKNKYNIKNIINENENIYYFENVEIENSFFFKALPKRVVIQNNKIGFIIIKKIKFVLIDKIVFFKIKTEIKI